MRETTEEPQVKQDQHVARTETLQAGILVGSHAAWRNLTVDVVRMADTTFR